MQLIHYQAQFVSYKSKTDAILNSYSAQEKPRPRFAGGSNPGRADAL